MPWLQYESTFRHIISKPIELYIADFFEQFGPASFIPVGRINNICAICKLNFTSAIGTVIAVNPIKRKAFL